MENENNNYSFTPITEDNSVNEIKDDFFGESTPEPSTSSTNEVPPILEVPEIKEEEPHVSAMETEPIVNDIVESKNNVETSSETKVEAVPVTESESNVEEGKQESVPESSVANEAVSVTPEPITEVNTVPAEEVTGEPVEVKIPEGLDEETTENSSIVTEPVIEPAPQVETTIEPVKTEEPASEPKTENPKKGKSIFDFFKKDTPTIDDSKPEPSTETPNELDPFNNFVTDVPESNPNQTVSVEEPVVESHEPIAEVSLSNQKETSIFEEPPVIEEKEAEVEEVSLPSIDEPTIPEPVIEPITNEENELPTFNNIEDKYESVKEPEPIVKEVVVEKEKVVLGKKCPNCGEVTAETFCPNCGFLVE